ncbi:MAG TPA: DNA-directed RNA polymerase subunit omega [Lachnospiraceae bacterium]|jgi:DNA-directed RNA polymerase, omega subunit|nr:DNA-directed RNA polymerase subunit omega [Lachnospiraceae bacterium]
MLRPSYSDLLEELNKGAEGEDVIGSRYTIVIAVAKRARQLVAHAEPLTRVGKIDKPVSIAVNELYEGKIHIIQNFSKDEDEVQDGSILVQEDTVE